MKTKLIVFTFIIGSSFRALPQESISNFQIRTDPRIELLCIFLNYTDCSIFGKFDVVTYPYYEKIKDHFDKFQNHPSVVWLSEVSENRNLDDKNRFMDLWYMDSSITLQLLRDGNLTTVKQEIPKEEYFEFRKPLFHSDCHARNKRCRCNYFMISKSN